MQGSTYFYKVTSDWELGQDTVIFPSVHAAMVWICNNQFVSEGLEEGQSIRDLFLDYTIEIDIAEVFDGCSAPLLEKEV